MRPLLGRGADGRDLRAASIVPRLDTGRWEGVEGHLPAGRYINRAFPTREASACPLRGGTHVAWPCYCASLRLPHWGALLQSLPTRRSSTGVFPDSRSHSDTDTGRIVSCATAINCSLSSRRWVSVRNVAANFSSVRAASYLAR